MNVNHNKTDPPPAPTQRHHSFTVPMYKFIKPLTLYYKILKNLQRFWLKENLICTPFFLLMLVIGYNKEGLSTPHAARKHTIQIADL